MILWKLGPLMLTVAMSMQLQWGPLMRDQYKGAITANYDSFQFFYMC